MFASASLKDATPRHRVLKNGDVKFKLRDRPGVWLVSYLTLWNIPEKEIPHLIIKMFGLDCSLGCLVMLRTVLPQIFFSVCLQVYICH